MMRIGHDATAMRGVGWRDVIRATAAWKWALLALVVIPAYLLAIPLINGDMTNHLLPWTHYILNHGRVASLGHRFSEYTPSYLYLLSLATLLEGVVTPVAMIKIVAMTGNAMLAVAAFRLFTAFRPAADAAWPAAMLLCLPTVYLNGPVWGQCDALYSSFILLCVAELVRRNPVPAMVWLGVAIAFKLQAVFILPLILTLLVARQIRLVHLAIPPAAFCAMMVPAWLAGRPARDLLLIYVDQGQYFQDLARSVPNIWQILRALVRIDYHAGVVVGLVLAAVAGIGIAVAMRRRVSARDGILMAALLAAIIMPYILPKMHNRYFFLADVLSYAWWVLYPSRRSLAILFLVQTASLLAYLVFLVGLSGAAFVGALLMTAALVLVLREAHARFRTASPLPDACVVQEGVVQAAAAVSMSTAKPIHIAASTAHDAR